ncbi:hypothetical protein Q3G72_002562 [Acer saccharum]|nr:hypothetical protein Q3G72_002562 [Acer saccharum]
MGDGEETVMVMRTWMLIVVSDKIWRRKSNFKPHLPIGNPRDKNVVAQGLPWWKNVTRKDSAGVNDMVGYGLGNKDEDYNKDYEYSYGNNGENGVVPIKEGFVFISQRNDMGPCVEIGLRPKRLQDEVCLDRVGQVGNSKKAKLGINDEVESSQISAVRAGPADRTP